MKEKDLIVRKNKELGAILEVSRVLTTSFDLDGNLTSVMNVLGGQLQMQRGCVFLLDPVTGELRIVAAHGLTLEEIRKGKYRIGEGIVGRVIESNSPMFVPDIGEEPRFLNRTGSRPEKEGISFLCVPIALKNEVLGVLSADRIYSNDEGSVDDDLRVLSIVSSLIAQFVKLWRNYTEADNERRSLRSQLKDRYNLPNIVGESERLQAVLKAVLKVADTDATVLLLGETGTGKELVARTIHFQSRRAKGSFVAVNCAAIPENLLETELFGCEKGAFTGALTRRIGRFELAEGGTIFLDEVGEFSVGLQAKLLRVLQERTFERVGSGGKTLRADVRVVAATNRSLEEAVKKGAFREDLYWRLNVVPIVLPPLRDRREDIPLLIGYYLSRFNSMYKKKITFSEAVMKALSSYRWPGNVRELANTLERIVIMAEVSSIEEKDLPYDIFHSGSAAGISLTAPDSATLSGEVGTLEKARIMKALRETGLIQCKAADLLGITARQLGYKLKKYDIDISAIK